MNNHIHLVVLGILLLGIFLYQEAKADNIGLCTLKVLPTKIPDKVDVIPYCRAFDTIQYKEGLCSSLKPNEYSIRKSENSRFILFCVNIDDVILVYSPILDYKRTLDRIELLFEGMEDAPEEI